MPDGDDRQTRPFADTLRDLDRGRVANDELIEQVDTDLGVRSLMGTPRPARTIP